MIEVGVKPVPVETVTPLKPSEALRLGRLLRPRRITGQKFRAKDAACALGAIEIGGAAVADLKRMTSCPEGAVGVRGRCYLKRSKSTVSFFITHLNDSHGWRDARIGEWLRGLGL